MSRMIDNPRELILGEARKILYNEGYSSVSIRRVAKECNISIGTIYNYFPTKKELILEMMTSYWQEFLDKAAVIIKSREDFYGRLRCIFQEVLSFVGRFKSVWLSREFYESPDYVEGGIQREHIYVGRLTAMIEELLGEKAPDKVQAEFEAKKMASFIIINFMSMVQNRNYDYDFFEDVLRKLLD